MPGKIKVKVLAGRNLPVMDRASDTTDAFVEIKFGGVTHKTDVCRKSLNPHWNSTEWYRFEVDESELQDEPLQLRLMDHDTYSANDAIGKVVISLGPLLAREANNVKGVPGSAPGAVMSGWIPVFDTMHGIRGELNVIVKVELFSDFNKYKTSSCGVQFFHCPSIPPGYRATSVHGFVEELVVNDDPEYQWIDKIRTPRASNEARQVAFIKLSNQVQRLVGLKAAELGANAVVGYQQEFDLEGEAGVVARAIGTAISVTPLPIPSQTMNIPPCTQQQLKKCLDILATDNETVTDLNEYYQTHQEELMKMISILNPKAPSMLDEPEAVDDDDDKIEQGRLSIHSFTGSMSLFQDDQIHHRSLRHLSEDQTDLNKLLSRKSGDDNDDSDSSGPIQKIKKMKTNFFTKRFSRRKRDKKEKQDDQVSLKSNSSDVSRISLAEIKNEFKKRFKKPKIRKVFTNPEGEGVEMASILARSVIHTQTSLACIAETQDSEHSAAEMRRTSESEPNINVSDDDKQRKISMNIVEEIKNEIEGITVPDIYFSSLKNMSSEEAVPERVRKISESCPSSPMVGRTENLLKLPGDKGYFGSVSSALSGESSEAYSSSEEEEDESSEIKSDSEVETVETTASVVNSVLNHKVNPDFIAQMERKLTTLEKVNPSTSETRAETQLQEREVKSNEESETKETVNIKVLEKNDNELEVAYDEINEPQKKVEIIKPSTSAQGSDKCVSKPNMYHIRIHNPFAHNKSKSFSAPSSPVEKKSFVYRSSKRIKRQIAKLSKSSMIKSISHYSLSPKKKEDTRNLSQPGSGPGSSSNVPSRAPSDTVLGSLFLSYSDLLSLDKEAFQTNRGLCKSDEGRTKVSMYIGSEPVSRTSLSGPSFPSHHREEHGHRRLSSLKPEGLIHTAMETILIDKVDTLLIPTSPDPVTKNNKQFFDDVSEKLEEHKNRGSSGISMGQVQSTTGSTTPRIVAMTPKRLSDDFTAHATKIQDSRNSVPESKGLFDTAMETVLMDKAHAILPETPEASYQLKGSSHDVHEKCKHKDHNILDTIKTTLKEHHVDLDSVFSKHQAKKENSPDIKFGGLIHTAMQTMLMDRAQSMIPDTPEPIPIRTEPLFERGTRSRKTSETSESSGLIHSAMQTILMDKFRAVIPNTTEPIPIHLDDTDSKSSKKNDKHGEESGGLVHNAIQTIQIDKVQTVIPNTKYPLPINIGDNDDKSEKGTELQTEESKGLTHTMLMDRTQSVIPDTPEPISIIMEPVFERGRRSRKTSETSESSGLIHSAMQTILMDKFRAMIPNTTEPIPIHLDDADSKSSKKNDKHAEESSGLVHNAMQTILIDKVQTVLPDTKDPLPIHLGDNNDISEKGTELQVEESKGLTHSAIQTMLIEKVQAVLPDTPEPIPIHLENLKPSKTIIDHSIEVEKPQGLVQSAIQTMLIEKVQSVLPGTSEPIPIHFEDDTTLKSNSIDIKPEGLLQSAMETNLLDKVNSLISPVTEIVGYIMHNEKAQFYSDEKDYSPELLHSAMETILIDKVETICPNFSDPDLVTDMSIEECKKKSIDNTSLPKSDNESRMVKTAKETILFDKVQSLAGAPDNIPTPIKPSGSEDLKSPALVETAMKTILMDKLQSTIATTSTNAPESSNVFKDTEPEDTQGITTKEEVLKSKKLIRQDSIHSISNTEESKMSNEDLPNTSSKVTRPPVLQHFHPILSGLETIPSMSESSFDRSVDGKSSFETNNASVCDNSHAACGFGRSERDRDRSERDRGSPRHARAESYGGKDPVAPVQNQPQASLNSTSTPMGIHRRSSDSDLSVTPKGGSLNTSAGNVGSGGGAILRPSMNTDNLDMLEYPFLTMTEYPPGFIVHIGGTVCARSVKLVDGGGESAARAAWWAELRTELRAHARALRCNAVIAYTDTCTICEDVCVLSASGTAAVINLDCDYNVDADAPITVSAGNKLSSEDELDACSVAHVPYSPGAGPYRAELSTCGGCRRARVPAVLLATCAKPNKLISYTKAVTLTAVAARVRRAGPGAEPGARDISDQLPFLEYELHRLLLAKLRMQGANALFGLSTQVALGERCVVALASGIAVKLTALPDPNPPTIKATEKDKEALDLQRKLWESFTANKAANGYDIAGIEHASNGALPEMDREELPVLDLCADKDACVLELDEAEDVSTARALCVVRSHAAAYTPALRPAIAPPHAFAQVSRGRLALSQQGGAWAAAERHVARALDSVTYKLRRLQPAAVAASFQLELPEDEIQLVVSGTAIPLVDPSKEQLPENGNIPSQGAVSTSAHNGTGDGDDDIFTLDEEQLVRSTQPPEQEEKAQLNGTVPSTVSLTTLSHIAGVKVARRVCALRLLFVRETTAVRELGGLSGFLHTFTCEVLAIARAYTAALGGNALTSFYIRQLMLQDNAHKNQGQCLMSVGGDIVHITY